MTAHEAHRRGGKRERGFTLIEMLVALAVMAVLVAAAVPITAALIDRDREREVEEELKGIGEALEEFYFDHGTFPVSVAAAGFLNSYLLAGVNGTAIKDSWGGNADYLMSLASNPDVATVYSRGLNGADDGVTTESLKITVYGSVPGNRRTRDRMRVIIEALANFIEAGGTLTGVWDTDRAALGLGAEYARDGFNTLFQLDKSTCVLRSAGPDRAFGTADDLTS